MVSWFYVQSGVRSVADGSFAESDARNSASAGAGKGAASFAGEYLAEVGRRREPLDIACVSLSSVRLRNGASNDFVI